MKNPIWLRLFFLFVVLQALLVGSALIQPTLISLVMPWPASPLNARFIGALYIMGAISALLSYVRQALCRSPHLADRNRLCDGRPAPDHHPPFW